MITTPLLPLPLPPSLPLSLLALAIVGRRLRRGRRLHARFLFITSRHLVPRLGTINLFASLFY